MDEIQTAIDGAVSPEQAIKLRGCFDHIHELVVHEEKIEQEISRLVEPFSTALDLIRTHPSLGTNPMTVIVILSKIGPDMSVFPSSKHLIS